MLDLVQAGQYTHYLDTYYGQTSCVSRRRRKKKKKKNKKKKKKKKKKKNRSPQLPSGQLLLCTWG